MNIENIINYIISKKKPNFTPVLEKFILLNQNDQLINIYLLLSHHDVEVRSMGVRLATKLNLDLSDSAVDNVTSDEHRIIRWFFCDYSHACNKIKHLKTIKRLLTNDIDPLVRSRAAVAMGDLGGVDDIAFLEEAITQEHGENHEGVPISSILRDSINKIAERNNPQRRD